MSCKRLRWICYFLQHNTCARTCKIGETINEKWPLEPKWDYPKSKVRTEKVIHERHGKIPAVIMRIAGVMTINVIRFLSHTTSSAFMIMR